MKRDASNLLRLISTESMELPKFLELFRAPEGDSVISTLLKTHWKVISSQLDVVLAVWAELNEKFIRCLHHGEENHLSALQAMVEKTSSCSMQETLNALFASRETTGDFPLRIKGSNKHVKVHSSVMYAAWPYFRQMWRSNMRDVQKMELEFPGPADPHGMPPTVLELLVQVAYNVFSVAQAVKDLSVELALRIDYVEGLYIMSYDEDENHQNSILQVLALAQKILQDPNIFPQHFKLNLFR
jgi:hypothetical protein